MLKALSFRLGLFSLVLAGGLLMVLAVGSLGAQGASPEPLRAARTVSVLTDTVFLHGSSGLVRVKIASDSAGRPVPVRWRFSHPVRSASSMDSRMAHFTVDSASSGLILFQPADAGATGYATILLDDGTKGGLRYQVVFQARPGQGNSVVFASR